MTLVMAWREHRLRRVWFVSDSRLSYPGDAGRMHLTDSAAKLLVAPRILRQQIGTGVGEEIAMQSDVGFAYAGNSLIALQAYVAVLPLWAHLRSIGEQALPPMRAFADNLGTFVLEYTRSVSAAHESLQSCQCSIVGFDHPSNDLEGWIVEAIVAAGELQIAVREMALAPGQIEILGSGRAAAEAALNGQPVRKDGLWRREPLDMIRTHLRQPPDDVGGGVQIGFANEVGFQLSYDVQASETGFYEMRYRGFAFDKVSRVGEAFCSLPGLFG